MALSHPDDFYSESETNRLLAAYRHVFGPITSELRSYWDLDRKREWGCLTTDYEKASYAQLLKASKEAVYVERNITHTDARGKALRAITQSLGVGLSIGVCPWTDHGLHLTYDENHAGQRATIILGHDWYPIVPARAKTMHPVDVPLRRGLGLHGVKKYINIGAVPRAIYDRRELLLFMNLKPDFRAPGAKSVGPFNPPGLDSLRGFEAVVRGLMRNRDVRVISYGSPAWEVLRDRVDGLKKRQGILAHAISPDFKGTPLNLRLGGFTIKYLPLAHPCDRRNFNPEHAAHAARGFDGLGLGGAECAA
jgi:hypothetical protein